MKYLTYNELLNRELGVLDFKRKNKNTFLRKTGETIQKLYFGHSTWGERHVKYYSFVVRIDYLPVIELSKAINDDNVLPGIDGGNSGYFTPQNNYKEWRIAEDDDEEVVEKTAKDIVHDIKLYIMPFLNRYTDMNHVIEDEEKKFYPFNKFFIKDRTLLVMYYIQRGAKYALSYGEHYLEKLRIKDAETPPLRIEEKDLGYAHWTTYHVKGMELQMFEELYSKLKKYIEKNEC